jgi:Family of unknown function (DUF6152)
MISVLMRIEVAGFFLAAAMVSTDTPILAHHAFSKEFDSNNRIYIDGTVTKVEWQNPHPYLVVEVQDAGDKKPKIWRIELNPIRVLLANGWTEDSVKPGMEIIAAGFRARNPESPNIGGAPSINIKATGQVLSTPPGVDRLPGDAIPRFGIILDENAMGNAFLVFLLISSGLITVFLIRPQFRRHFPDHRR